MSSNSNITANHSAPNLLIGGDILSLITSGMYASPLAIYREYLQNAADSISSCNKSGNGRVEIKIDISEQRVTIRDNGPGLSYTQAKRELVPISRSGKRRQHDRGFRGIGRLSGLAFGNAVIFLTRQTKKTPATQIIWDREKLRDGIDNGLSVEEIISQCVTIEKLDGDNFPANFFEVQVEGISRYAASSILNRDAVRQYLGEVCPVPFHMDFPYISHASNMFGKNHFMLTLDVYLNEETTPVTKLHKNGVYGAGGRVDEFVEFEEIQIPMLGDTGQAAVGWLAHSSYLGALRKAQSVRCLRARAGNIQIGSETVFDHLFSENRFNRWCVGEIHILDSRIVPNGRRDYFEPSIHLRNLENYLGAICHKLERRCRMASKQRNQRRDLEFFLESLDSTYDLVASGYLTAHAARQFVAGKLSEIPDFREKYEDYDCAEEIKRLNNLEKKLTNFRFPRGRGSLAGINSPEVSIYRKIFKILAETSPSPRQAKKAIEAILGYEPT